TPTLATHLSCSHDRAPPVLYPLSLHDALPISDVQGDAGALDGAGPPLREGLVIGGLVAELPVHLRVDVVDPALAHPGQRIGGDHVVGLRAAGVREIGRASCREGV